MNGDLLSDATYSPTEPGEYTWPLEDTTGYYSSFLDGPLPPIACTSSAPSGTKLLGCFTDSPSNRLLHSATLILADIGSGGMTVQVMRICAFEGGDALYVPIIISKHSRPPLRTSLESVTHSSDMLVSSYVAYF